MKELYCLHVKKQQSLEKAWTELEQERFEVLYGTDEDDKKEIYLYLSPHQKMPAYSWIASCTKTALAPIDWEAQWSAHGLDFHNGAVHVSFETYGRRAEPIALKPGPGFGDLSHPTTRLILQLMGRFLREQPVVDIGCGSGVLTVAALAMGAPFAYGIDIDPAALAHAYQNAQLNHFEASCQFSLPEDFLYVQDELPLLVMNMISSEQKTAWESLACLHGGFDFILTSGVRREEKDSYLEQTGQWGWALREEIEEGGWLGFCFIHQNGL